MEEDWLSLILHRNKDGLLECYRRLPDLYPIYIYIPEAITFTEKFVQHAHKATLHGGVGLTMAKIKEEHWIPYLGHLARKVIRQCYGWEQFIDNLWRFSQTMKGHCASSKTAERNPERRANVTLPSIGEDTLETQSKLSMTFLAKWLVEECQHGQSSPLKLLLPIIYGRWHPALSTDPILLPVPKIFFTLFWSKISISNINWVSSVYMYFLVERNGGNVSERR